MQETDSSDLRKKRINPRALSEAFYTQHMQSLPVPSTQILHMCLHPGTLDSTLVLEQQYAPRESLLGKETLRTVELSENPHSSGGNNVTI
jgi:hypothetical protein